MAGKTAPLRFEDHAPEMKRRWGHRAPFWDEIEPAFRFGWDMARDPGLAGHSWAEAEKDLADHWYRPQSPSEEMAWDQVRDAVRLGWTMARAAAAAPGAGR